MMASPPPEASGLPPLAPTTWEQGWLSGVRHCPSPNFGPRPQPTTISLAVVHSISLPPGQYGTGDVEALFTNTLDWDAHPYFQSIRGLEVSAHFLVTRDGHITQFVSVLDRAWHAGKSSWQGRDNCNDYSVGIELEGLEGELFEPAQYRQLAWLCTQLAAQWPIDQVVGHEHIAPGRKQDPGPGFHWPVLQHAMPTFSQVQIGPKTVA
jgi:N-acetyl-anhydromuramoyl-L-alanine amidase